MSTKNRTNLFQSVAEYKAILYRLAFAKQKLLASEIPHRLRVISYLRISCSAMRKIHHLESNGSEDKASGTPYLSLLKSLSEHDLEWWNKCEVRGKAGLRSDDPAIEKLLQPLNTFINSRLEPLAA